MPDIQAPAYTLPAGPIGVLLVHGFTASPTELRTLGDYLHQAGFSIQGVRTAGHGTNLDDLGKCTRRDWYASVEAGYRELSEHCQHIVAIGLSMGALLCCRLASEHPLSGLGLLAPAFGIRSRFLFLAPWLGRLLRPIAKSQTSQDYYRQHQLFSYPAMPATALGELYRLIGETRPLLPRITTPCKIYMGLRDRTVEPISSFSVYNALGSQHKSLTLLPNSNHILTVEPDANLLFCGIRRFIENRTIGTKKRAQP